MFLALGGLLWSLNKEGARGSVAYQAPSSHLVIFLKGQGWFSSFWSHHRGINRSACLLDAFHHRGYGASAHILTTST